jgi:hypothetical protein
VVVQGRTRVLFLRIRRPIKINDRCFICADDDGRVHQERQAALRLQVFTRFQQFTPHHPNPTARSRVSLIYIHISFRLIDDDVMYNRAIEIGLTFHPRALINSTCRVLDRNYYISY